MKTCHHGDFSPAQLCAALRAWYSTSVGELVSSEIKARVDSILPRLFGYYALQIGELAADVDLLDISRIKKQIRLDIIPGHVNLLASAEDLPFQEDSLDLIILVHSLDFAADPYRILREVDRTLIPEGHVVIIGFNPLSLFGVWKMVLSKNNRIPWCGRFYSSARLRDWFSLLGFDTLISDNLFFRPPIQHAGLQQRLNFLEKAGRRFIPYVGGVHVILAQKKLATLTPIKPRWRPRKSLLPSNLTEPSTREVLCE